MSKALTIMSLIFISGNALADIPIPMFLSDAYKELKEEMHLCNYDCEDKIINDVKEKKLSLYVDDIYDEDKYESKAFTVTGGTDNEGRACGFTFAIRTGPYYRRIKKLTYITDEQGPYDFPYLVQYQLYRTFEEGSFQTKGAKETENSFSILDRRDSYISGRNDEDSISLESTKKNLIVKWHSARPTCVKYGPFIRDFIFGGGSCICLKNTWSEQNLTCKISL